MTEEGEESGTVISNRLPKTTGPYQVFKTTDDTVTIDEAGIPNTVSIDRATVAPSGILTNLHSETLSEVKNADSTDHTNHDSTIDYT